ncbi:hypothetical protein [Synechococcus sp. CS-205]|uniref:hypothetical protein n=1 Tax=Synechococcus sp. CS-205 TaxID=2847984 RepID=UPI00223C09EC|nr:hypothetical protein [Synechococcus sp. CS-205]MCT0248763.1 hypothetical protein [Synechococcus sp. CS-205]
MTTIPPSECPACGCRDITLDPAAPPLPPLPPLSPSGEVPGLPAIDGPTGFLCSDCGRPVPWADFPDDKDPDAMDLLDIDPIVEHLDKFFTTALDPLYVLTDPGIVTDDFLSNWIDVAELLGCYDGAPDKADGIGAVAAHFALLGTVLLINTEQERRASSATTPPADS